MQGNKNMIQDVRGEIFKEIDSINKKPSKFQETMGTLIERQNALESLSNRIEQVEERNSEFHPGVAAHACNPSTLRRPRQVAHLRSGV